MQCTHCTLFTYLLTACLNQRIGPLICNFFLAPSLTFFEIEKDTRKASYPFIVAQCRSTSNKMFTKQNKACFSLFNHNWCKNHRELKLALRLYATTELDLLVLSIGDQFWLLSRLLDVDACSCCWPLWCCVWRAAAAAAWSAPCTLLLLLLLLPIS